MSIPVSMSMLFGETIDNYLEYKKSHRYKAANASHSGSGPIHSFYSVCPSVSSVFLCCYVQ